ncbi:hypothetical protein [Streptomyces natalensis]|uniref:hypothetical protein n=1 Tax=Streptomyces natalensis TaxID=68242 RepID=UPI000ABE1899|nr:hypothetical protein [Streptomyces natalensis]
MPRPQGEGAAPPRTSFGHGRIKGAGSEKAKERPTATVEQVDALADGIGPRWRLVVY